MSEQQKPRVTCPNCGARMGAWDHGHCSECGKNCGCSFNATSSSDFCDHHALQVLGIDKRRAVFAAPREDDGRAGEPWTRCGMLACRPNQRCMRSDDCCTYITSASSPAPSSAGTPAGSEQAARRPDSEYHRAVLEHGDAARERHRLNSRIGELSGEIHMLLIQLGEKAAALAAKDAEIERLEGDRDEMRRGLKLFADAINLSGPPRLASTERWYAAIRALRGWREQHGERLFGDPMITLCDAALADPGTTTP